MTTILPKPGVSIFHWNEKEKIYVIDITKYLLEPTSLVLYSLVHKTSGCKIKMSDANQIPLKDETYIFFKLCWNDYRKFSNVGQQLRFHSSSRGRCDCYQWGMWVTTIRLFNSFILCIVLLYYFIAIIRAVANNFLDFGGDLTCCQCSVPDIWIKRGAVLEQTNRMTAQDTRLSPKQSMIQKHG